MGKSKIVKHHGTIVTNDVEWKKRILVGVPVTGQVRIEWAMGRWGQVVPTNWSQSDFLAWINQYSPLRFSVAEARNIIANKAVVEGFEWLLFIDHDVVLPPGTLLKFNEYMMSGEYPIINGLYFTRSRPSEPLAYRGLGTGHYRDFKIRDKIWVDGCGLGCTLIHGSILKAIYDDSPEYQASKGRTLKRIFVTPGGHVWDEDDNVGVMSGTEDLNFYHRLKDNGIYEKAGWPEFQKKEYPLMMDTSIFCKHIEPNGTQFPLFGEEKHFMPEKE